MKGLIFVLATAVFTILTGCRGGDKATTTLEQSDSALTTYDSVLARQLGADDYGMRSYVMAFLKAGPSRDQPEKEAMAIQRAHLDHIQRLSDEGKLVLAGPFLDNGEVRGIFLFNVPTLEEARELTAQDPAVISGRLIMDLHPWYGSATLLRTPELHSRISRINP